MNTVLFACIHNAGRSQMAAALFNALADPDKARAISAGTEPASQVHPEVLEVMREAGIDLSASQPRRLTPELAAGASLLVTMGCGETCPVVPGLERLDWPLTDPKGQAGEVVRAIREEIRGLVLTLLEQRGWMPPPKERSMSERTLTVYEPAMCCSSGVCGPDVDPALARFSADLEWLAAQGLEVRRHNLAQEPGAFVTETRVKDALARDGEAALPMLLAGPRTLISGTYPTREQLARWFGLDVSAPCCGDAPPSGCC